MAYSDDFLSPQDRCEICGAELQDEVVIQEFADGSLARLCPECAAGAALDDSFVDEPEPVEEKPAKRRRGFRIRGASRSKAPREAVDEFDARAFDADLEPLEPIEPKAVMDTGETRRALFDAEALESSALSGSPRTPAVAAPEGSPVPAGAAARDDASADAAARGGSPVAADAPSASSEQPEPRPAWPSLPTGPDAAALRLSDEDLLDRTRELLLPVTDLIALQGEVQSALERLAASLERFAAEMITDSHDKAELINSRLQTLEHELDVTRSRLREAEALLPGAADLEAKVKAEPSAWPEDVRPVSRESLVAESRAAIELAELAEAAEAAAAAESARAKTADRSGGIPWPDEAAIPDDTVASPEAMPTVEITRLTEADLIAEADRSAEDYLAATSALPARSGRLAKSRPVPPPGTAQAAPRGPSAQRRPDEPAQTTGTFRIDEVQAAQRYYNESTFVSRIRDVRRSIGKPKASVTRLPGEPPRAIVTIFWDIVWYQYLVDLRRDLPSTEPRVVLHREGMDLDELAFDFKQKNAVVNDDGRLDASELEVRLLSDPSALITEMNSVETQALEDATEEIWNQKGSPEFRWDD